MFDRGDYAEAIEAVGLALDLEPLSTEHLLLRATARTLADDEDGAREDLYRAAALDPEALSVFIHRGGYFFKTGLADLALRDLDRAVALGPEDPDTYSSRARVFIDLAQRDVRLVGKAISDLNQAIRRSPDSAELHTLRGVAFWMRRSEVAAVADFSRAIALAPGDREAWLCRARSRIALRDASGGGPETRGGAGAHGGDRGAAEAAGAAVGVMARIGAGFLAPFSGISITQTTTRIGSESINNPSREHPNQRHEPSAPARVLAPEI